jgi:hypothetical protein
MTADWTAGYVTDVAYTTGYYGELNPFRASLPLATAGFDAPRIRTACELGFGQGLSVALHAAAQPGVEWWGTDFNPAQAANARALAEAAGATAHLFDQSFAEFCARADLPDFDFIAMHGTWSWVSDENRKVLADFVRRKLRLGGVLFMSYNAQPAWAASIPLRHLMKMHADIMGAPGQGTVAKIDEALGFIDRLFATEPRHLGANPAVAERLAAIKGQNRAYVAHEYMNRDWAPMAFSEVQDWFAPAKADFACSAEILDQIAPLHLKADQIALLAEIPDRTLRETARDFCINRQFRRDYWMRGLRRAPLPEQQARLQAERVVLTTPRAFVGKTVTGAQAQMTLAPEVYDPILDLLADHRPRNLGELQQALADRIAGSELVTAVMVLVGQGSVASAVSETDIAAATPRCIAVNRASMLRAQATEDVGVLACPVTGGGLSGGRFQQLFALAATSGKGEPADWAAFVWEIMKSQKRRVLRDGAPIASEADNLAALVDQARSFEQTTLPMWRALGMV